MTTMHQKAHMMEAASRDASNVFPDVHAEAMHYRKEFGRAWGMLEGIVGIIEDDELPEAVRDKVLAFQIARIRKALSEWKA